MTNIRPLILGAAMAPFMLWMAHGPLTAGMFTFGWAAVMFLLAHLFGVGLVVLGGFLAAKRTPRLGRWMRGLHRPRLSHMSFMVLGVFLSRGIVHLTIHGGLV